MSFFAGFVNGVFRGMDWRENRDDRRTTRERDNTRWDWAQEDRTFTLSERERVASEREETRARAAATRMEAESRRRADEAAWGASLDGRSGGEAPASGGAERPQRQPVSIWYDEPVTNAGARTGGNTGQAQQEAAVRPTSVRQRSGDDAGKMEDRARGGAVSVMQAPAIQDNAPIPSAASVARDEARRAEPQSIADLEASLAAAPQPAQPDRSAQMMAQAQAAMPAARAAATRPAPAPQSILGALAPQMPARQSQEQIEASLSRMHPAFRGAPVSPPDPTAPTPPRTGVAAEMSRQSEADRGAISAALAPYRDPTSSMSQEELAAYHRLNQMYPGQTQGRPMTSAVMPPVSVAPQQTQPQGQGAQPMTPSAAPVGAAQPQQAAAPDGVRREIAQAAQAAPQQMPQTQGGTPTVSIQSVAQESVAAAQSSRGQANTPQARQQVAERFEQRYREEALPPIVDHYIRTGRIREAREAMEFFDRLEVRQGMQSWARAIHAYSMNDTEGMVEGLLEAYNNEAYYPDGLTAVRRGTRMAHNDDGEIIGADITFRDNATGRQFTQQIRGINDLIAVGVGTLSPEAAFEHYLEAAGQRRQAAGRPSLDPAQMRQIEEAAYERASGGGLRQPTQDQIQAEMQAILSRMGVSASGIGARGPVPVMH